MILPTDLERAASHWSVDDSWQNDFGRYWLQLPAVQQRWNLKMSGSVDSNWVDHALAVHLTGRLPLERCLSLGCGGGRLERQLAAKGAFVACDAYDIAEGAIRRARQLAEAAGYQHISYAIADMNTIELAEAHYDAVWAVASVHHVTQLDHLFSNVARSLKPDGFFILNEYVGPSQFQFAERQREIIQACNALLPPDYRRVVAARLDRGVSGVGDPELGSLIRRLIAKLKGGDLIPALRRHLRRFMARRAGVRPVRDSVNLPTAHSVTSIDPTEAIRSAEIVPVLRQYFDIVDYKPLGGAILQFLLADIAGNFVTEDGERLLQMLFEIENTLMACEDISSDFAYMVARPRR